MTVDFEAVLAATTDGLVVFSLDDVVTFANPTALQMLGQEPGTLVGTRASADELLGVEIDQSASQPRGCWEIMDCSLAACPAYHSDDLHCWLMSGTLCEDGRAQQFAEKRERCTECEVHSANADAFDVFADDEFSEIELDSEDAHRIVKVRMTPLLDSEGVYTGRVLVIRDVTHEHEIAQMKNEFVSTVSHELRTPLTSIKGYVDLIVDGDAGEISDIQREFLTIVQENSDRLVELINDMLDISRIESGRIHLKIEPIAIEDSIADAVDTFQAVLSRSGRTVKTEVPLGLPPVAGDRDRVGRVLINFISNAIKYSPEGGDVTVSAEQTDDGIKVSVTDSGLGISREDQKLLFTKFYRVDSAITREIGGTGLGLSICKSIIELLGGTIGVHSVLGEGSTFYFTLPLATADMVRMPLVRGPEGEGTVLVVDSDPEIAALIETHLAKHGYDVLKAYSAEDAMRVAVESKPQVITLDVILEGGDGFELLQQLKEQPETSDIPVVVLSIVCDEGRSCRFGAANYLEKPIDQDRLLSIIGNLAFSMSSPLALVVDDDRAVVGLLSETLRRRGFAVVAAYDGAEALAAIEQRRPDIILLDLRMPKVDGYEVLKTVKRDPVLREIPIIVMTAYQIDREQIDLIETAAGFIDKPLSPEMIADKVDELISSKPPIGETA